MGDFFVHRFDNKGYLEEILEKNPKMREEVVIELTESMLAKVIQPGELKKYFAARWLSDATGHDIYTKYFF